MRIRERRQGSGRPAESSGARTRALGASVYSDDTPGPTADLVTASDVALIALGYVAKSAFTFVLWRRYGARVRSLGRLARSRRSGGRPVLVRASPGHVSRTFRLGPPRRQLPAARSVDKLESMSS